MRHRPLRAVRAVLAALVAVAVATLPASAAAPTPPNPAGFQSPSKNIHCLYVVDAGQGSLRCDVLESTAPAVKRPASCEFDYGPYVGMGDRGTAKRLCVSDTVADPGYPVVAYGRSWTRGRITCTSSTAGIRCTNADKHGFQLSRAAQKLF